MTEKSKEMMILCGFLALFVDPPFEGQITWSIPIWGSVISISEHPLDPVPIQLVCEKMVASGKGEHDGQQNFEFLWENVKRVTEYGKLNPPSMTKYQQNFCLMIEEVVNNHTHLFTSEEKLLLGSFDSLSNNAQRLFVRIYTRKGPWFRMSNISYPEISDLQTTSEELRLAGYICSFNCSEDVVKYNIKEVLEVLNVFEMREISNSILSKKGVNLTRRQELIDALFSAYEDETCQLLPKMILERAGTCIKISSAADILFWRVQRLFFLNGEQDFSAFLLSDLGLIKFPQYNCAIVHPIFQYRSDLLEYEEMAPLDFLTDDFYITRRNLIELHLQKIQKGKAGEILIASWDSHVGTACHGVNWDRHSLSDLRAVVSCIGGSCLASLCRHLALDYRSWCSGMPDLLLWRFHGGDGDAGRAKLVEVKGPRDRLSEQQRAWMLILMDCGFDVEVCKVGSP